MKIAAIKQEIKTISSHSAVDAALIPLAPLASRTFLITYGPPVLHFEFAGFLFKLTQDMKHRPSELGGGVTLPPVNVGVTAATVRVDLVALATAINANVPGGETAGTDYIVNANGTVTSDFVQVSCSGSCYRRLETD